MATAAEQRSDRRRSARRALSNAPWIAVTVAASTFLLAFDAGTYSLSSRTLLAIGVWWIVAVAWASWGWPSARPATGVVVVAGLLGAFAFWSAASVTWAHDDAA